MLETLRISWCRKKLILGQPVIGTLKHVFSDLSVKYVDFHVGITKFKEIKILTSCVGNSQNFMVS